MDKIDLIIIRKLRKNSRVIYRELAEMIDMSVSAVHKSINKLTIDKIIDGY